MATFEFWSFEGNEDGVYTAHDGSAQFWLKDYGEMGYELVAVTSQGNGKFHFFMQCRNEDD